jgi:hypothetical protein
MDDERMYKYKILSHEASLTNMSYILCRYTQLPLVVEAKFNVISGGKH